MYIKLTGITEYGMVSGVLCCAVVWCGLVGCFHYINKLLPDEL